MVGRQSMHKTTDLSPAIFDLSHLAPRIFLEARNYITVLKVRQPLANMYNPPVDKTGMLTNALNRVDPSLMIFSVSILQ